MTIAFLAFRCILLLMFFTNSCNSEEIHSCFSTCGDIGNISYPFRLKGDLNCEDFPLELACLENRTVLSLKSSKYYVESIDYNKHLLRVIDHGVKSSYCNAFSMHSVSYDNIFDGYFVGDNNIPILFISCPAPVNSPAYINTSLCNENRTFSSYLLQNYTYIASGESMKISDLKDSCNVDLVTWMSRDGPPINMSYSSIHEGLGYGFDISWEGAFCRQCYGRGGCCLYDKNRKLSCQPNCGASRRWIYVIGYTTYTSLIIVLFVIVRCFPGILCLFTLLVYKWRRRHVSMFEIIEDFLQGDNRLRPIRYTYSEIRKMTYGFKDKSGEGGYGTVYKGKLRSGIFVAVKMMNKSITSGQEFISEVSTIGRIHHVNVVRLISYCAQGSKRALVYEFMPNGSLEKYIFPQEGEEENAMEKMFEISLGVARAIDYLHRGCDMQILHFDIKPHNILLDDKFTPKISDFGLAKLYPTEDSIVSLTAARGTLGYMAPELFYRNIGGVSYKADVYSFGMLLLEMAGRRKNLNPIVDQLSQIYFPAWVYDQLNRGNDMDLGEIDDCDKSMVKKMIIVALWCIQMKPNDRPGMNRVVEMLEGDFGILRMPPKPFLSPQEMPSC